MLPYYWNFSVGAFHSSSLGGSKWLRYKQDPITNYIWMSGRYLFQVPNPIIIVDTTKLIEIQLYLYIYVSQGLTASLVFVMMRRARDMRVQWLLSDYGQLCGLWLTMTLETLSRAERDHLKVVSILLQLLHDIGSYALEQTEFRQLNLESRNGLKY